MPRSRGGPYGKYEVVFIDYVPILYFYLLRVESLGLLLRFFELKVEPGVKSFANLICFAHVCQKKVWWFDFRVPEGFFYNHYDPYTISYYQLSQIHAQVILELKHINF